MHIPRNSALWESPLPPCSVESSELCSRLLWEYRVRARLHAELVARLRRESGDDEDDIPPLPRFWSPEYRRYREVLSQQEFFSCQ